MRTSSCFCLGPSFEQPVRLEDGGDVRLRWVRPTDADLFREGFMRLSMESRVMRFFAPLHTLSDETVRYLTDVDGINHAALLAVSPRCKGPGARGRGYGVARFVRSAGDPRSAEFAVTVLDDAQGRGLGRRLVETLALAARERGIETFEMSVLESNRRVRRFLRRIHAEYRGRDGEVLEYGVAIAAILARRVAGEPPRCRSAFIL
jgi:ribosomal protein S18 acetylase RimI-like enzyme